MNDSTYSSSQENQMIEKQPLYVRIISLILKCLFAFFLLLPFLWAAATSFKPLVNVMADMLPFSFKAFIPHPFTLEPYVSILKAGFGQNLFITLVVCGVTLFIGLLINAMAGFAFAKLDFPFKQYIFILVIISFMIPFEAIAIPLYITVRSMKFLNTIWALIIPSVANGLCIFLFRQFFKGIPNSLIDAATIDGANWASIFFRIFIPLSLPVMISAGLMLFISQWQSFVWPLIAVQKESLRVAQVAISYMTRDEYNVFWNQLTAASIITAIIPLIIIFPLQKYYIRGISGTGIK